MAHDKKKELKSAKESLDDILKRIGPFRPQPPRAKPEGKKEWQIVTEGTFPPYPLTNQSAVSKGKV